MRRRAAGSSLLLATAAFVGTIGLGSTEREGGRIMSPPVKTSLASLPVEGPMPAFSGAVAWINSPPLTPEALRGKVVVVDFWTYTCVNWLRTLPYVRAWAAKYKDRGLVVIGVHTPEFSVEKEIPNIRRAVEQMRVDYPIAVDTNYGIWNAFQNEYWPALYVVDAQGRIRYHHFGEGEYEESERVIQQLLTEAGASGVPHDLVSVDPRGTEVSADWSNVRSGESYVGYEKAEGFASPGGAAPDARHVYFAPKTLGLNQWALTGDWTIGMETAVLNMPKGRIAFQFHARDVNLVMGSKSGAPVRFRVLIDGHPPGPAHGTDVDDQGGGTVAEPRLYQLIRQPKPIDDRLFEIEFLDAGAEAFCFTFG